MSQVICALLVTGQEIIGKVCDDDKNLLHDSDDLLLKDLYQLRDFDAGLTLKQVRVCIIHQDAQRGVSVSFAPLAFSNPDAELMIDMAGHAIGVWRPVAEFECAYLASVSGIAMA